MKTNQKTVAVKCWGRKIEAYADADGTVRVYDSVAGYYTVCHSLTKGQEARVRRLTKGK
jgi:hypothetical protein